MMIDVDNLTKESLAALLDSTFLKAFGGPEKIDDLCREAAEFGFASVAVNGCEVARCAAMLKGTGVKVTAVAGFPLGQMSAEAKLFEVRDVIAQGAGEVDIVQNVRRLQAGDAAYVLAELEDVHRLRHGRRDARGRAADARGDRSRDGTQGRRRHPYVRRRACDAPRGRHAPRHERRACDRGGV